MNNKQQYNLDQWLRSQTSLIFLAFLAIAGFFLVIEYSAHFFGVLPYLLLFLCLLLHLFMHGSHGEYRGYSGSSEHAGHDQSLQQNPEGDKQ